MVIKQSRAPVLKINPTFIRQNLRFSSVSEDFQQRRDVEAYLRLFIAIKLEKKNSPESYTQLLIKAVQE